MKRDYLIRDLPKVLSEPIYVIVAERWIYFSF